MSGTSSTQPAPTEAAPLTPEQRKAYAEIGAALSDYCCAPAHSEEDKLLHELALRYHIEAEAYDSTVCTGPIIDGSVQPANPRELALIGRNASALLRRLSLDGSVSPEALRRAVTRVEMKEQPK